MTVAGLSEAQWYLDTPLSSPSVVDVEITHVAAFVVLAVEAILQMAAALLAINTFEALLQRKPRSPQNSLITILAPFFPLPLERFRQILPPCSLSQLRFLQNYASSLPFVIPQLGTSAGG